MEEEFGIFSQRGFDAGVIGVLDLEFPAVLDHPARDEVIIVCVERTDKAEEDIVIQKAVAEWLWLKDLRAVSRRAAGDDEDASIDGIGGSDLEVVSLEV